jgi:Arc/MetJ-type ribon-helix-helix transcriptional regulator
MLDAVAQIAIRLSDAELAALDRAVDAGRFRNRAEAVRAALRLLHGQVREDAIEQSYRHAYERHPLSAEEQEALDGALSLVADLS